MNYFEDTFRSVPDHRKIVLILFLTENDVEVLHEYGFLKNENVRLCLDFKKF